MSEIFTVRQAAKKIGVTSQAIYDLIDDGHMNADGDFRSIGRRGIWISEREVEKFCERKRNGQRLRQYEMKII